MLDRRNIVPLYGVVEGVLPDIVIDHLQLPLNERAVGVILRFQSDGSIRAMLYPPIHEELDRGKSSIIILYSMKR